MCGEDIKTDNPNCHKQIHKYSLYDENEEVPRIPNYISKQLLVQGSNPTSDPKS